MSYRRDLWEASLSQHGVVTVALAEEANVPAVELRKLAARGALEGYGQGVYVHRDVPFSPFTQPAVAVALAGDGAFLHRESVFDLLGIGNFDPKKIRVATYRRVRRKLPEWMALQKRNDVPETDLTTYNGIRATTVRPALVDMYPRMPRERWTALLDEVTRREFIDANEAKSFHNEYAAD